MTAQTTSTFDPQSAAAPQGARRAWLAEFVLACIALAGICAQIMAWAAYTGDDINTLAPVARHSVMATIVYYIRPIEYYLVEAANQVWLPLWLFVSALACAAAACVHLLTVERLTGQRIGRAVGCAIVAGSPIWFYAISQVDTVSQSLCNLVFAGALHSLVRVLQAPSRDDSERWYLALNLLCGVLLFTKELAIGAACVLPAVGLWHYLRNRRIKAGYAASAVLFAVLLAAWVALKLAFKSQMPEASGHYNLSPSLTDIARNVVASLAFGVTPLPSSFLSIASLAKVWTVCGSIAALLAIWACTRLQWRSAAIKWWAFAMLGACSPMFYVHASELYASMIGTLLAGIVVTRLRLPAWAAGVYGVALVACSYINAYVYYHGDELAQAGVTRTLYSVYYGPNGQSFPKHEGDLACPVGRTVSVSFADGVLTCYDSAGGVLQSFIAKRHPVQHDGG